MSSVDQHYVYIRMIPEDMISEIGEDSFKRVHAYDTL